MKRISALLLAIALTLGSVTTAQANGVDVKVKGQWDFAFGVVDNRNFNESTNQGGGKGRRNTVKDDNFEARQRVRTQVNFIASEYLQGVLMFEIGDIDWGRDKGKLGRSSGGGIDADGVNVETKRAFLDWIIPNTDVSVRMGIQGIELPATRFGSQILSADVAGITVSSPVTDWLSLTALWARPLDEDRNSNGMSDTVDAFGLVAPMTFESFTFSPYFVYAFVGGNSGYYGYAFDTLGDAADHSRAKAWWAGANTSITLMENLVLGADFAYGHLQRGEVTSSIGTDEWGTSGWYAAATLDYKMDFGTPGIFGWYGTGNKENSGDAGRGGRMPYLGVDGQNFKATSFGGTGYYGIGNGGNDNAVIGSGTGSWGIGLQVADMTFIEDLSHTIRVAYYRGTNDEHGFEKTPWHTTDSVYLTKDDSVIEVNFDHKYQIYENLTAVLELGYIHLKSDKETWGYGYDKEKDNAWKAEINFRYSF